ncbi:hypothetical protein N7492_001341 [Penicillium capsulatum]|uniref:Protein kinase domain-containing protein n=1 Tax=Penicillium capsulatum TaxID=69766 RepID=A0A9W9IS75_9EURO|nr:hypothetical protein N7492_001341 [Penicillium capsulatum]KAJ6129600.1 hypothetical protein N7512_002380 [Penicillium capsulatum]
MFGINNDAVFQDFEEFELQNPRPRKQLDDRTIYTCRSRRPDSLPSSEPHTEDIQPNIYRVPEVILEAPWADSVDIWNAGCVVRYHSRRSMPSANGDQIWDLFEGGSLFSGWDPEFQKYEFQKYRSRAHLAEMIRLLGPPPTVLLAPGDSSRKFFSEKSNLIDLPMRIFMLRSGHLWVLIVGDLCAVIPIGEHTPLEQRESNLEGEDQKVFLRLVRKTLQWEPERRKSAGELEQDKWTQTQLRS